MKFLKLIKTLLAVFISAGTLALVACAGLNASRDLDKEIAGNISYARASELLSQGADASGERYQNLASISPIEIAIKQKRADLVQLFITDGKVSPWARMKNSRYTPYEYLILELKDQKTLELCFEQIGQNLGTVKNLSRNIIHRVRLNPTKNEFDAWVIGKMLELNLVSENEIKRLFKGFVKNSQEKSNDDVATSGTSNNVKNSVPAKEKSKEPVAKAVEEDFVVDVFGRGKTKEDAIRDACDNAIQKTLGMLVDAETLVEGDEIVKERILSVRNGFVKKMDFIDEPNRDGDNYVVLMRVTIGQQMTKAFAENLSVKVQENRLKLSELKRNLEMRKNKREAERIAMERREDEREALGLLVRKMLTEDYVKLIKFEVESTKIDINNENLLRVKFRYFMDQTDFENYIENIVEKLKNFGLHSDDGTRYAGPVGQIFFWGKGIRSQGYSFKDREGVQPYIDLYSLTNASYSIMMIVEDAQGNAIGNKIVANTQFGKYRSPGTAKELINVADHTRIELSPEQMDRVDHIRFEVICGNVNNDKQFIKDKADHREGVRKNFERRWANQ